VALEQTLGEFIKEQRKNAGLNMSEVARKLKVSHTLISQIEKDRVFPSEEVMLGMAKLFEIDAYELIGRSNKIPKSVMDEIEGSEVLFELLYKVVNSQFDKHSRERLYKKWMNDLL
jgi:transcriptional regulator with XRE-family HTH domain